MSSSNEDAFPRLTDNQKTFIKHASLIEFQKFVASYPSSSPPKHITCAEHDIYIGVVHLVIPEHVQEPSIVKHMELGVSHEVAKRFMDKWLYFSSRHAAFRSCEHDGESRGANIFHQKFNGVFSLLRENGHLLWGEVGGSHLRLLRYYHAGEMPLYTGSLHIGGYLYFRSIHDGVVEVKLKGRAAAIHSREADVSKENLESIHGKKSKTNIPLAAQNCENALVKRDGGGLDVFKSEAPLLACVATQTSSSSHGRAEPCLLKDLRPKTRQGCCFDEHMEAEGWSSQNYMNIDDNIKDPQMCCSYAPDIYFFLQMAELKRRPAQNFMEAVQRDINTSMRSILVDWLVEVAEEYKLVPDTLYLTIAYIDRFLSGNMVNRQRLQLLGVACMLIASKYEEICAPQVDEFCYITDNTYGRDEVLQMEKRVLNYLQFELTGPTTKTFLRRFIRAAQAGQKTGTLQLEYLGNYLAELTLVEYGFLQYLPSMIASSAVFLAKVTLNPTTKPWNSTLQHYSGYKPSELVGCVKAIHDLQCNKKNCTLPAVREKYKHEKFKSVANLTPPAALPLKYFEDLNDTVL